MNKKIILLSLFVLMLCFFFFKEQINLGWGYDIERNGSDTYITKGGIVVVGKSIIDMQITSGYLIGLKLPAHELVCDYKPMRVAPDRVVYFILDLDRAVVKEYYVKNKFEKALEPIINIEKIILNYDLLGNIFKFGERLDKNERFKPCLRNNGLGGYKVVRLST
jgi:hypothetical protein